MLPFHCNRKPYDDFRNNFRNHLSAGYKTTVAICKIELIEDFQAFQINNLILKSIYEKNSFLTSPILAATCNRKSSHPKSLKSKVKKNRLLTWYLRLQHQNHHHHMYIYASESNNSKIQSYIKA